MKIGITRYPFTKIDRTFECYKKYGFDTVDYNLANTDVLPYVLEGDELKDFLKKEKELAKESGNKD